MSLDFNDYYFSDDIEDYNKDLNQRNILIKQVKQTIRENKKDEKNFQRMVNNLFFLRNTFTRESILEFVNEKFKKEEMKKVGDIFYEALVNTKEGVISDHRRYADSVFKLMETKNVDAKIKKVWENYVETHFSK
jgi:hypothetical protein